MPTRFRHFEFGVTKDFGVSDARQIPASGVTVEIRRLGAVANGGSSFGDGVGGVITVRDPGRLRSGDTIVISTAGGTPGSVSRTLSAATETSITVSAGSGVFTWSDGSYFTATNNKPNIYADPVGGGSAIASSQLTTDSRGFAHCWADEESVDRVESGGGVTTRFVPNLGGTGGSEHSSASITTAAGQPAHHSDTKEAIASDQPIHRFSNNGVEKVDIHGDGSVVSAGGTSTFPTLTGTTETFTNATITNATITNLTVVTGSTLPTGDIVTADLAVAAATNTPGMSSNSSTQVVTAGAGFTDLAGDGPDGDLAVTITPDSSTSVLFIIASASWESAGAAGVAHIRLFNETSAAELDRKRASTSASGEADTLYSFIRLTGITGANKIKVQWQSTTANSNVFGTAADGFARLEVIEFKKQS